MKTWYILFRAWLFVNHLYNKVVERREQCYYKYASIMQVARQLENVENSIEECIKELNKCYMNYSQNWASGYYLTFKGRFVEKIDFFSISIRRKKFESQRNLVWDLLKKLNKVMKVM